MNLLDVLLGETRARLLRVLRKAPATIPELAETLEVSENAVRTHVAGAELDGLVRQSGTQRATGGKPARVYELTQAAEELFPKAYALVLTRLLQVLRDTEGEEAALEYLRQVGRDLAATAPPTGDDIAERVMAAAETLESVGGSVSVSREDGGWVIRGDGCPLSAAVAMDADVCALAEALVAEISGRDVVASCDRRGRPRCVLHVLDEARRYEPGVEASPRNSA